MKTYSKLATYTIGSLLVAVLVLAPAFTFAKENGKEKNNEKEENKKSQVRQENDNKKDKGCFRAFGHLISPGWIKHNGQLSVGAECHLPFGIAKKFRGTTGTTTPSTPVVDTTAPVISVVRVNARVTSAVVRWTTNEKTNGVVYVGGQPAVTRANFVRNHEIVVNGLTASTTYSVVVTSRDQAGNTATSSPISFTTKSVQTPVDANPPVVSGIVTLTGTTTLNVKWSTNEYATSRVYYTASSSVDVNASTTLFVDQTSLVKNHMVNVSGLATGTTYALIVESVDASGNVTRSSAFSATTGTPAPVPPVVDATAPVISNSVLVISSTTAHLSWITNESATTKAYYATSSPVAVNATTTAFVENVALVNSHAITVSGLATSTSYYVVFESKDVVGNTTRTGEFSFATAAGI